MRKSLSVLFSVLLFAFLGLAGAQKYAVYMGYPFGLGGMYYLSEDLRLDGSLDFVPGGFGLGVGADKILRKVPIVKQDPFPVNFYFGAGVATGFATYNIGGVGGSVIGFGVNGFAGVEYRFAQDFGFFSEVGAGPALGIVSSGGSTSAELTLDFFGRIGLNFY